ncbi:cAMP-dependent protein kinase inhibitor alpha [Grus japonensis]|uniref:cAMP-dependent protein kinase inhibitor alpha n=1 Tax=Grus japonensis TaxID=30415 RepID=A0ABC9XXP6_GRUJA
MTKSPRQDDTKLSGAVDMPEGQDAIQRDLDKIENGAPVTIMRSNTATCKVLHTVRGNPGVSTGFGDIIWFHFHSPPVKHRHDASFSPVWSVELVLSIAAAVRLHFDTMASVIVST